MCDDRAEIAEKAFAEALAKFPYELRPTGHEMGEFESDDVIEYSKEFEFPLGKLFDRKVMGGGWIELHQDEDSEIMISGFFSAAFDGNWQVEKDLIFGKYRAALAWYEDGEWEFVIDDI